MHFKDLKQRFENLLLPDHNVTVMNEISNAQFNKTLHLFRCSKAEFVCRLNDFLKYESNFDQSEATIKTIASANR